MQLLYVYEKTINTYNAETKGVNSSVKQHMILTIFYTGDAQACIT